MKSIYSWLIVVSVLLAMVAASCTPAAAPPAAAPAPTQAAAPAPTEAPAAAATAPAAAPTVAATTPVTATTAVAATAPMTATVAVAATAPVTATAVVTATAPISGTAAFSVPGPEACTKKTAQDMGCKYGAGGKCKVVLSNSFIGNDWRIQMQNTAKAAAQYAPFKDNWDFSILNTDYSAEAQNAALDNLLTQGVDIVLLDAYSPSAHNDWIQRAQAKGVTVVSFDIVSNSPLDYKVESDFPNAARVAGRWFAKALNCQGKIAMDLGLQATQIAKQIADGGRQGIKDACGDNNKIEEVATFYGQFAEGPMEPAISSILATNPKLDGVFTQGYCTTVVSAYEAAGRLESDHPVLYCQGYNSNFLLLANGKAQGVISANSPAMAIMAMQKAYEVRCGIPGVPKYTPYELGTYATDTKNDIGTPYEKIELNKNAFANLPGGFSPVYNVTNSPPNEKVWVQITLDDLQKAGASK